MPVLRLGAELTRLAATELPENGMRRDDVDEVLLEANARYLYENALNSIRFLSLREMESEIVEMTGYLVNLPPACGGTIASGGSESILMSVLVNRDRARPPYDFRLPGVTDMSADVHKYGDTTTGASVILHRIMAS